MKRKLKQQQLVILAVISVIIVSLCIIGIDLQIATKRGKIPRNTAGFTVQQLPDQQTSLLKVYEEKYQNQVHQKVEVLKQSYQYDIQNPLLISNPYQTVTNGLYVYFQTKENYEVEYVISAEGYSDFTQTAPADTKDNRSLTHEFLIVGLIMSQKNHITINLKNENDHVVQSVSFDYDCPKALGPYDVNQIEVKKGESLTPVSDGLYAILGNDIEMDMNNGDQREAYLAMYDNDGVLRVEIPLLTYRAHRLIFDENGMYFSVSGSRIVRMEPTGYVNRVYKLGDVLLHHDYLFGNRNDIVVLGSDYSEGTKEDVVFSIDLDTKEITTIIDLKDNFPDYFKMTTKPKSSDYLDWMHINSLSFVDEESVLLSSRETSTIIKMDNIYDDPTVDYMIGSENFWEGTGYEKYLLTQEGDFSLHAGQHTVTYGEGPEGNENQYYIYMYNNNNAVSFTRPKYDWKNDSSYQNTGRVLESNGANSSYYKYLVDKEKRTFTLMNKIDVEYSGYISSAQEYKGNVIIDSGFLRKTWEYDSNGVLIQEVNVYGTNSVYRTYKYDFEGYWFKKKNSEYVLGLR